MKFAVVKNDNDPLRDTYADKIIKKCLEHGHEQVSIEDKVNFVLNLTSVASPQFFRRRAQSIFVFSLVTIYTPKDDLHSVCFTTLVQTLSNMLLCLVPGTKEHGGDSIPEIYFTTPESGFYHFTFNAEDVYKSIIPIAGSHFAIHNRFTLDLPEKYTKGTPAIDEMMKYSKELDSLGVLPAPFPLKDILSEENLKHLYNLFEIKGLSWGNLSVRENIPELGTTTFWMSARGVNKSSISKVGWDILLIKGFDYENGEALVSVSSDYDVKARVSVDAIEHQLIYSKFPDVGAIVHVHAWMENIKCTRQNYPCGTRELGEEVLKLLQTTENPSKAVVGLKNHGITITGQNLEEIFSRIKGQLILQVPMFK